MTNDQTEHDVEANYCKNHTLGCNGTSDGRDAAGNLTLCDDCKLLFEAARALGMIGGKSRSERKLAASNANRMKALAKLAEMRNEKRAGETKENNEDNNS